jgi:hypothetical protein
MSRNGSGTYTLPAGNPVVTGTTISSTWANSTLTNIASALTDSLAADGQTTATGNLKMGNNRITGLADGIAATDAATVGQSMIIDNMPAFSVYLSADQTVSASTFTKAAFDTEEFDTNNNFDSTTNYRFTPTVAGYYQINFVLSFPTGANVCIASIYKNGSEYSRGTRVDSVAAGLGSIVSAVLYFNGSTDYVEAYGFSSATTFAGGATGAVCKFSGSMVRGA